MNRFNDSSGDKTTQMFVEELKQGAEVQNHPFQDFSCNECFEKKIDSS